MAITTVPNPNGRIVIIDEDDRAIILNALAMYRDKAMRTNDPMAMRAINIRDYIADNAEVRIVSRD
jgi:hypothetical protein